MPRRERDGGIRPSAPAGWRWVQWGVVATMLTVVTTVGLGVVALAMKLADASPAVVLSLIWWSGALMVLSGIATLLAKVAEVREKRTKAAIEWWHRVSALLTEPARDGRLPRLSELSNATLGATPTKHSTSAAGPYVARPAADCELVGLLRTDGPPYPFVILRGDSKAGKSRTLAEAVRTVWPDAPVILTTGEGLAGLVGLDPPLPIKPVPAVVWLDDLTAADLTHLTGSVLASTRKRAIVVATITSQRYNAIVRTGSDTSKVARAALNAAHGCQLAFDLTDKEREQAHRLYPDERIEASIGETLVGGEELLAKLDAGRTDNPAGQAIVHAAVDCRRVGLTRGVSDSELKLLFPRYLRKVKSGLRATDDRFATGLEWAAEPVASQVALLRPIGVGDERRWEVLDYIVSAQDGQTGHPVRAIPFFAWTELLAIATPSECYDIAQAAMLRDERGHADKGFRTAKRDPKVAPKAAFYLGSLLVEQGRVAEAADEIKYAVDNRRILLGDDETSMLTLQLGASYLHGNDIPRATATLEYARDFGDTTVASEAAFMLGVMHYEQGDMVQAELAYQHAIDLGHSDMAPKASVGLGVLLEARGDRDRAKAAYRHAMDAGHAEVSPKAAASLGALLGQDGDVEGAAAALQFAIDSGGLPANEAVIVGEMLDALSDSRSRQSDPRAAFGQAVFAMKRGDVATAKDSFQRAIDSGDPDWAGKAAVGLGHLHTEQGDADAAQDALQLATGSSNPEVAGNAWAMLGALFANRGDGKSALDAYRQAIVSGGYQPDPKRAVVIAVELHNKGDLDGAIAAYRCAMESDDPDIAPEAACSLARLLADTGDPEGAKAALEYAIDSGHPEWTPMAAGFLSIVLRSLGDTRGADAALRKAMDTGWLDVARRRLRGKDS
jgi:tetratricopeptide (TPR) repeat protein